MPRCRMGSASIAATAPEPRCVKVFFRQLFPVVHPRFSSASAARAKFISANKRSFSAAARS